MAVKKATKKKVATKKVAKKATKKEINTHKWKYCHINLYIKKFLYINRFIYKIYIFIFFTILKNLLYFLTPSLVYPSHFLTGCKL